LDHKYVVVRNPYNFSYQICFSSWLKSETITITFASGLSHIDNKVFRFRMCSNLESIIFEQIEPPIINKELFSDCHKLKTISIPAGAYKDAWLGALVDAGLDITADNIKVLDAVVCS